jgi:predicted esterase
VLVRRARSQPSRGVLAGFHGYTENAAIQLARLDEMAGADAWTIVSIQGLHRFYRHRTQDIAASWMTREDRETAIADNIAYVTTALEVAPDEAARRVVYAGFSQGVAMAFRAACRGRAPAAGVMAVGGDVPPELLADAGVRFPPVLLARGRADEWYTADKYDADLSALRARGGEVDGFLYEGAHEWTAEVTAAAGRWLDYLT